MNQAKLQALRTCAELWEWLAEDPTRRKYDFLAVRRMTCSCPCCDYVEQELSKEEQDFDASCADGFGAIALCPMRNVWPRGCANGLYDRWCEAVDLEEKRRWAQEIAQGAREEMGKLERNAC